MSDGMTEANKDQAEYEAKQKLRDEMEAAYMTEFPEDQHDYETRQLIAQTVEQTLAKLREQERAQKHENDLAEAEGKFENAVEAIRKFRFGVYDLLKLFAGDDADRLNTVSLTSYEHSTVIGWNIDKEYGWAYAPIKSAAVEAEMDKCIKKANEKRAQEPTTLADELDDNIPF